MKKVAIVSPDKAAYSETFIQAHKNIKAEVFYYYGGSLPTALEGKGELISKDKNLFSKLKRKFFLYFARLKNLTPSELALLNSFKRNKIEVVLAEFGPTAVQLLKVCQKLNLSLVPIFHGYDASVTQLLLQYKENYLELFKYSKKVIVVSRPIESRLIELGCNMEKIIFNPCAPSDSFFQIVPTFKEPLSFVSIGRFVDKKAPYYTILSFEKVCSLYPEAKLYFAGDGELLETCKNIVRAFGLEKNIIFLGAIRPSEYKQLLSRVSGMIQHSIRAENGDSEGTPVAILEASAAGIPVVSTIHGGIPDAVIHNITGLLSNEHDVQKMAENIIELIQKSENVKIMGQAGRIHMQKNYCMSDHLKKIEDALN